MELVGIRRYPVKAMGGEELGSVVIDGRGLVGDRLLAVTDDEGRFASAKSTRRFRRRDAVLQFAARTETDGTVVVTGAGGERRVGDPALDEVLADATGATVRVAAEGAVPHQDMGAVSLVGTATLAWCARRWGGTADVRRLRANLLVATEEPFAEEAWVGRDLRCGTARLRVVERVPRCRTVDLDQDGAVAEGRWLARATAERDGFLAVYADVVAPGTVRLGDDVSPV